MNHKIAKKNKKLDDQHYPQHYQRVDDGKTKLYQKHITQQTHNTPTDLYS